jgi:hypothetical protein
MASEQESQSRASAGVDERDNFATGQTEGPMDAARSECLCHGFDVVSHTIPT